MTFTLRKADRRQAKLRIGLFGPSGSGKTMSSLKIAHGIAAWDKIAIIDTENGSADLYAHVGPFNVITLQAPFTPERYIEALRACEDAGMEAVIIDSITHEWAGSGGILEIADQLGKDAKNSYMVWAKITPRHNKFIDAILASRCHVICCGRSKQDYAINQIEKNGKTISVPEKLGLKAITREGFEYEMTVTFDIPISHLAVSTKDRTGLFQDKPEGMLDEQAGVRLKEWAETGAVDPVYQKREIMRHLTRLGYKLSSGQMYAATVLSLTSLELTEENFQAIIDQLVLLTPEEAQKRVGPPTSQKPPGGPGSVAGAGGSSAPTPPPDQAGAGNESDKPTLSEADQAEIARMAFGGGDPKAAAIPSGPPPEKPSTSASEVLAEYQKQIAEAPSVDALNEVYGLITLDKRVIASVVLDRALKGLVEKRTNEILGIPEKPPAPQVAPPAPAVEQPAGKCSSCDGKGVTPTGADCAACEGTGIPKHA